MTTILALALPVVKSIAMAIVILIVGLLLIKWITKQLKKTAERLSIDSTLKPFFVSVITALLKVLLAVSVIKVLGIDTTSFAAVIAAGGLAIGLAFQGSLSNFAGGVLLLSVRPIKVGDYIEANGFAGTVQAIQILYTELVTVDNKVIYIPNGSLSNTSIVNYSAKNTRLVILSFNVGYEEDCDKVAGILKEIVNAHPLALKEPEPFVRMSKQGDSAIEFTVRVWSNANDYWTIYFDIIETVKKRFGEEHISIPFPQMHVHVDQK